MSSIVDKSPLQKFPIRLCLFHLANYSPTVARQTEAEWVKVTVASKGLSNQQGGLNPQPRQLAPYIGLAGGCYEELNDGESSWLECCCYISTRLSLCRREIAPRLQCWRVLKQQHKATASTFTGSPYCEWFFSDSAGEVRTTSTMYTRRHRCLAYHRSTRLIGANR